MSFLNGIYRRSVSWLNNPNYSFTNLLVSEVLSFVKRMK